MEIQKQILLFFSSIHNNFLNTIVQGITIFGEQFVLIAIAVFIYWNIDKKKGYLISMSILNATTVMGIAKSIVRFPRPWNVIPVQAVRQQTATGYSFPSGHTTGAASAYSAIAVQFKKRWLSICCAILILLVGLSRLYLCVHWPMDVVGGLLIGCGMTFIFSAAFGNLYDDKKKCCKIMLIVGLVTATASIVMAILLMLNKIDQTAFSDLTTALATYSGLAIGLSIERLVNDFSVQNVTWGKKIARYIVGMLVIAFIMVGLKPLLQALGIYNMLTRALRYFLVGFWACIFPIIGKKLRLFS